MIKAIGTIISCALFYMAIGSMVGMLVWMILDLTRLTPCTYTLADVPPGFEIVQADGVYRAKWTDSSTILDPYGSSDTSLCRAVERAVGQYEYSTKRKKEQNRKWEVVK